MVKLNPIFFSACLFGVSSGTVLAAPTGSSTPSNLIVNAVAEQPSPFQPSPIEPKIMSLAIGNPVTDIIGKPRIGVRVGAGSWKDLEVEGGLDVTFHVPVLPLPEIRFDAEAWAKAASFSERHGNAISLLAVQSFALVYTGIGPTFYFTDDEGDHKSGIGAKGLVGVNLPDSAFAEASIILGPSPTTIFFSIGKKL